MISQLNMEEDDEHVFSFDTFEVVYHKDSGFYVLSEEGYFPFKDINDLIRIEDGYILKEDEDTLVISEEEFEKLKMIVSKFN